jgi:hypothetical protein
MALILGPRVGPAHAAAADPSPIVGTWEGTLDPGAQPKKRVAVHISVSQDGTLGGTVDFPDQDVSDVQITAIAFKNGTLHFETSSGSYDGTISKDNSELTGTWKTVSGPLSLNLKRTSG